MRRLSPPARISRVVVSATSASPRRCGGPDCREWRRCTRSHPLDFRKKCPSARVCRDGALASPCAQFPPPNPPPTRGCRSARMRSHSESSQPTTLIVAYQLGVGLPPSRATTVRPFLTGEGAELPRNYFCDAHFGHLDWISALTGGTAGEGSSIDRDG